MKQAIFLGCLLKDLKICYKFSIYPEYEGEMCVSNTDMPLLPVCMHAVKGNKKRTEKRNKKQNKKANKNANHW